MFWVRNSTFLDLLTPIAGAIAKLESDSTTLSVVKHKLSHIKQTINENLRKSLMTDIEENKLRQIIENRSRLVITTAHNATYMLDLQYQGKVLSTQELDEAAELITFILKIINDLEDLNEDQEEALMSEIVNFQARS